MTILQDAANFEVLSGISAKIVSKEVLSPCYELLLSACLQPSTVDGCISLQERRGCSGTSTPVPADDDSSVVRVGSNLPLTLFFAPTCTLIKQKSFSLVLMLSLRLHSVLVCYHPASRSTKENFSTLFLVVLQRCGW